MKWSVHDLQEPGNQSVDHMSRETHMTPHTVRSRRTCQHAEGCRHKRESVAMPVWHAVLCSAAASAAAAIAAGLMGLLK